MSKKTKAVGIPTIDLCMESSELAEKVVRACEEYGIFKVVNHGVPKKVISRLEDEGIHFFAKPISQKQQAGPPTPFGYGSRNIGSHGDMGHLDCAVREYIEAAREVACKILDVVAEGLRVPDKLMLSRLIRDAHSDSVLRLNHYPANWDPQASKSNSSIGFGEHSDPQILTILRSNDVSGLQICTHDGLWIPVPPDPNEFFVMVGDALQVFTNARFRSVRHRALTNTNSGKARLSIMYFGAPPLNSWITPLPIMLSHKHPLYKPFTWAQYKQAAYSLRLRDSRLDLFKAHPQPHPQHPITHLITASP
ncbi:gibberellin 2-beta-dioxygenase 2-like [Senna tora]|uniref:Gibberellin 2-beta-dioxygenase 2-like n=1 Tax=Senna tora TaxID=362788 RepID=A0A834W410_9FABA|nr:gibberellin 2-beta-dioxygenase 2-like [Senna tora]